MVMVGLGTGIAPIRSFMQDKLYKKQKGITTPHPWSWSVLEQESLLSGPSCKTSFTRSRRASRHHTHGHGRSWNRNRSYQVLHARQALQEAEGHHDTTPMVMVGLGTGIAPIRSFMQDKLYK